MVVSDFCVFVGVYERKGVELPPLWANVSLCKHALFSCDDGTLCTAGTDLFACVCDERSLKSFVPVSIWVCVCVSCVWRCAAGCFKLWLLSRTINWCYRLDSGSMRTLHSRSFFRVEKANIESWWLELRVELRTCSQQYDIQLILQRDCKILSVNVRNFQFISM